MQLLFKEKNNKKGAEIFFEFGETLAMDGWRSNKTALPAMTPLTSSFQ